MYDIACIGILVADVICKPVHKIPERGKLGFIDSVKLYNGGGAMTAAINLKKLGANTAILGKVGEDGLGMFLKGVLDSKKVNTDGLVIDPEVDTSASVVIVDGGGERTFLHCKGSNGAYRLEDVNFDIIADSKIVFFTGSTLMDAIDGEPTAELLKKCKEMGKITALDLAWDDSGRWMELVGPSLPYVDYFLPSIEEAIELSGETELEKISDVFFNKGAKHVIIKVGKDGCYYRESPESAGKIIPTFPGKPVDTTGAGDSFCSGFLYGISIGLSIPEACVVGNATGTQCVLSVGATSGAKTYEEICEFIKANS